MINILWNQIFVFFVELNDASCLNKTVAAVNSYYGSNYMNYTGFNSTILESNFTDECTRKFRTASEEFWT